MSGGRDVRITVDLMESPQVRSILLRALDLLAEVEDQREPVSIGVARAAAELRAAFDGKETGSPFRAVEHG